MLCPVGAAFSVEYDPLILMTYRIEGEVPVLHTHLDHRPYSGVWYSEEGKIPGIFGRLHTRYPSL